VPWVIVGYRRDPDPPYGRIPIRQWREPPPPAPKPAPKPVSSPRPRKRRATSSAAAAAERRRREALAARRRLQAKAKRDAARRARQIALRQKNAAQQRLKEIREKQQAQVRESRKRAYSSLQESASATLRRASPSLSQRDEQNLVRKIRSRRTEYQKRQAAAAEAGRAQRAADVSRTQQSVIDYRDKKRRALAQPPKMPAERRAGAVSNVIRQRKTNQFNPRLAEEILTEEARRAGSGQFDTDTVSKLTEKYVKHAQKIGDDYNKAADKLQAQIDRINKFIKAGNIESARNAYATYLKLVKTNSKMFSEYDRLFGGAGGKPGGGAVNKYFAEYAQIEKGQTEWWKRQMQSSLDADRSTVNSRMKAALSRGDEEEYRQYRELADVYAGKTSVVYDPTTGKSRYRTVEEELDYREAQRRVKMLDLRAQFRQQQFRMQKEARLDGLVPGLGGRFVKPEVARVEDQIKRFTGGKLPTLKRSQDLQNFAGDLIASWEREERAKRGLNGLQLGRGAPASNERLYGQFLRDQKAFEKSVYAYFGSGVPEWWDRALAAPGISHGLSFLNAIPSIFGVGARAGLGAATGSTQFDFGATPADAPALATGIIRRGSMSRAVPSIRRSVAMPAMFLMRSTALVRSLPAMRPSIFSASCCSIRRTRSP